VPEDFIEFIASCCVIGPKHEVAVQALFSARARWCEARGRHPGTEQLLGRYLRRLLPDLKVSRPRTGGGRERRYVGLALKEAPPAEGAVRGATG
jgi:putative DNA primase/helicase